MNAVSFSGELIRELMRLHWAAAEVSGTSSGSAEDARRVALHLASEAGEVAGVFAKQWEGKYALNVDPDEAFTCDAREELADLAMLTIILAELLEIDLVAAVRDQLPKLRRKYDVHPTRIVVEDNGAVLADGRYLGQVLSTGLDSWGWRTSEMVGPASFESPRAAAQALVAAVIGEHARHLV